MCKSDHNLPNFFIHRDFKYENVNSSGTKRRFISKAFPRRFQTTDEEIIVPYKTVVGIDQDDSNRNSVELMWDHFVQNQVLLRTFHGFSGVGKHFSVNRKRIVSSEIHPMSGIQSIYDSMGKKLLR